MSQRTLTLFLTAAPYSGESAFTAMRLANAALDAGYRVNLFASADAVHGFTLGQRAKGLPNAEAGFRLAIERGLRADLCGSCLTIRGVRQEQLMPGAEPSSMSGLFRLIRESDAALTLGS